MDLIHVNRKDGITIYDEGNTILKYHDRNHLNEQWFQLYQKFQKTDTRFIQVLDVGFCSKKEQYFVRMEKVTKKFIRLDILMSKYKNETLKKRLFGEWLDIFGSFIKFDCGKKIFYHDDMKPKNLIYLEESQSLRVLDPDSFVLQDLVNCEHLAALTAGYFQCFSYIDK